VYSLDAHKMPLCCAKARAPVRARVAHVSQAGVQKKKKKKSKTSDVSVHFGAVVHPMAHILQKSIPKPQVSRAQQIRKRVFGNATLKKNTRARSLLTAVCHLDPDIYERLVHAIEDQRGDDTPNNVRELLNPEERVYSFSSGPCTYGTRQGIPDRKPMGGTGWVKFKVNGIDSDDPRLQWSRGFHGPDPKPVMPILNDGLSSPADRGCQPAHGQAGTDSSTQGRTIYTSPCIGYAAHPTYTPLIKTSKGKYAQIVLEVRVDQERVFNKLQTTLGKLYWKDGIPFDAQFSLDDVMEWLVADRDAVLITGVMFREMGTKTEECLSRYGEVACSFSDNDPAAEYRWTEHLAAAIEQKM